MGKRVKTFDADELHWYALDVARQKEYVTGHIFNRMGCVTFIPTEMRFRKKNRYTKGKLEVAHAAVPGVIFVGFPSYPNWYRVMSMHLVNGVLSLNDSPSRIQTASKEWMDYRSHQVDGHLVIERHMVKFKGEDVERSAALIKVQGRGVIRAPWMLKGKASADRPLVIKVEGERARILRTILGGAAPVPQKQLEAA